MRPDGMEGQETHGACMARPGHVGDDKAERPTPDAVARPPALG
jgi:hypothetical protein